MSAEEIDNRLFQHEIHLVFNFGLSLSAAQLRKLRACLNKTALKWTTIISE